MEMRNETLGEDYTGWVNARYRWPEGILYYSLATRFTTSERQQIESTLRRLQQKIGSNCIKFMSSNRRDAVQVSTYGGCQATVGYMGWAGGRQTMSLAWNCLKSGTIEHEFLHSLGIHHTQNHWDRDSYVDIQFQNIDPDKKRNFQKQLRSFADTFGLPYDYSSVMHYGEKDFSNKSKNNRDKRSEIPKKDWTEAWGVRRRCQANQEDVQMQLKPEAKFGGLSKSKGQLECNSVSKLCSSSQIPTSITNLLECGHFTNE